MSNFLSTLKMEFRGRFELGKNPSKRAWGIFAINMVVSTLIYLVFLVAVYFVTKMLLTGTVPMNYEFLVVATSVSMVAQLFTSTQQLVKVLYHNSDSELLVRFPIDGRELFLAKATYVFLHNLIIALVLTLPFYVFYGYFTASGVGYYFSAFFITVFISFIPFSVANLIAVPVMNLNNLVRNKFGLKLMLIIILIAVAFTCYMLLLRGILEYYKTQEATSLFSEDTLIRVKSTASALVPMSLFANILYGWRLSWSIPVAIGLTLLLGVSSLYIGAKSFYPTLLKSLEKGKEAFEKKKRDNKPHGHFYTLFRTELLVIFRSFPYSFQYLAMAITAPLMVYFCNSLAVAAGNSAVGGAVIPGLTMLVILIFDTVIVSFASTTVSRNGETFYMTKIIPVRYEFQIFVKMVLYYAVAGGSTLISCVLTLIVFGGEKYGGYMSIVDVLGIFGISTFVILMETAVAVLADLKSPVFDVNSDGDLTQANKNISASIILGIAVAVIYGLFAMIFTYLPLGTWFAGVRGVYIVLNGVSFVLAAVFCLILFLRAGKMYQKLVP